MAYNKNLYTSSTSALDAGIVYDQTETKMQSEVNAALKSSISSEATTRGNADTALQNTLNTVETDLKKMIPVITGTTNNSGYTIAAGDYFLANGALYRATESIASSVAWAGKGVAATGSFAEILLTIAYSQKVGNYYSIIALRNDIYGGSLYTSMGLNPDTSVLYGSYYGSSGSETKYFQLLPDTVTQTIKTNTSGWIIFDTSYIILSARYSDYNALRIVPAASGYMSRGYWGVADNTFTTFSPSTNYSITYTYIKKYQ